jgi:G:T-mismatch repair DNA endonuclease (very short patch repair protein)
MDDKIIEYSKEVSSTGNPKMVKKVCEWTGDEFWTEWKTRQRRFKDIKSMYAWRKDQNHTTVKCLNCGKDIPKYKISTKKYCSNECAATSDEKIKALKKWANSDANHWNDPKVQAKVKKTKKERYGDANYNNMEKNKQTMFDRYGVHYSFHLPHVIKSAGTRISKFQRRIYDSILLTNPDALLEHYLSDVQKSVDIYIPSKKKVVECFGDYWHCNPSKYSGDYYNKNTHLTAKEMWKRDKKRCRQLKTSGYDVQVVWESDSG